MEKCVIMQKNGEKTNRRLHYVQIWNAFHGIEGQQGRGLTREEAEDALGLRQGTVSNWEMAYTLPDEETLEDIGRYFGVDICFLIREEWDD